MTEARVRVREIFEGTTFLVLKMEEGQETSNAGVLQILEKIRKPTVP